MANGWGPTSHNELFDDIYQKLRIQSRHRHSQNLGEVPGAIDASGGTDMTPILDYYVEGEMDNYPLPMPPESSSPPQGEDAGPVPAFGTDITPTLGTVRGVTRAEIVDTVHTTGSGESVLVPDVWSFTNLDHTDGADIGAHATVNRRIIANDPSWYEMMLYAQIDWPSSVPWVTATLDWISNDGNFQPVATAYSSTSSFLISIPSRKFWLNGGGWMTCAFAWGSTTAPTSVVAAIDVTRIS